MITSDQLTPKQLQGHCFNAVLVISPLSGKRLLVASIVDTSEIHSSYIVQNSMREMVLMTEDRKLAVKKFNELA